MSRWVARTQSMIDELNPAPEITGIANEAYNGAKRQDGIARRRCNTN
jgi:hypothetical protein